MSDTRVITANPYGLIEYWALIRKHRSLIWVFALQEIKTMYAQTYLGIVWSVVRPLITLLIFTIIFNFFLKVETQSPYYLFAFVGMMAWNLFAQIATQASSAVVQKQQLIRKMFFPKMILPLAKTIVVSVEFGVSLAMLFVFMLYERMVPSVALLSFPLFVLLNLVIGLAIAIWMNALTIRFRDLTQLLPTVIGIGIWVTPVFFPTTIIPSKYNMFVYLNPMAGVIKGYRYALLGEAFPEPAYWWAMSAFVALFIVGLWYFIQVEDDMVDYA
jgi:lipopolysaccharide transport system permease protein